MRTFWKTVVAMGVMTLFVGAMMGVMALFVGAVMTGCTSKSPQTTEKITLYIGGMTAEELERALDRDKINVANYARSMLKNRKEFIDPVNERESERGGRTAETLHLVWLRVRDLGFTSAPTTTELFARAKERGLELCPPEVGPYLRLANKDQPPGWYYIGMEPVADSVGDPRVFYLARFGDGLWLLDSWAYPGRRWVLVDQFVFGVRKPGLPAGRSDS